MWLVPRRRVGLDRAEKRIVRGARGQVEPAAFSLVTEWERRVARYLDVPHAAAVNSGRQGMRLILEYLGLGRGDEVIIPAYTLGSLVPLIRETGAEPVPADIDPGTLNVTPDTVARRLSSRTRAVMVLHAFGSPAPVPEIAALCACRGIPVIEDCAHALGARLNGESVGGMGYAGFFSFEPNKPLAGLGGGMVVSRDPALTGFVRARMERLPLDPQTLRFKARAVARERWLTASGLAWLPLMLLASPVTASWIQRIYRGAQPVPSGEARFHPVQAALGMRRLDRFDASLRDRRRVATLLTKALPAEVAPQAVLPGAEPAWYFYVVRLPVSAGAVRWRMLVRYGVDAAVEGEVADDCARLLDDHDCPVTASAYARCLALPLWEGMSEVIVNRVVRALTWSLVCTPKS